MRVLVCEHCGCSGELGMGWISFIRSDAEDTEDDPWVGAYCPACAEAALGIRPDVDRNSGGSRATSPTPPLVRRPL